MHHAVRLLHRLEHRIDHRLGREDDQVLRRRGQLKDIEKFSFTGNRTIRMARAEIETNLAGLAGALRLIQTYAVLDAPLPQFRVALPPQVMVLVAVGPLAAEEIRELVELPIELRRAPF